MGGYRILEALSSSISLVYFELALRIYVSTLVFCPWRVQLELDVWICGVCFLDNETYLYRNVEDLLKMTHDALPSFPLEVHGI